MRSDPTWFQDPTNVTAVVRDVCAGLDHLHQHKYGHFDMSPRNVLENDDGVFIICNFGLAKLMRHSIQDQHALSTGSIPRYACIRVCVRTHTI